MEKVLLDTDIGSDIDDAVCLAYLLAQPECDLVGITTVSGESYKRAMMASALCHIADKAHIPIFPGAEVPLIVEQRQKVAQQAAALSKWHHETEFPTGQAIEFMRGIIRAHPGEITLLGIGPLTNIALLFAIEPEIPHLLKRLVLMCGVFVDHHRAGDLEWNAMLDPHAATMVYDRGDAPVHRSIGLDVTTRVIMNAVMVRERFSAVPLLRPVLDFAEVWFQQNPIITFHDPLAATTIFDERICNFQRGRVKVELENKPLRSFTHFTPGDSDAAPHEVAVEVNPQRFFEHYFSVFKP